MPRSYERMPVHTGITEPVAVIKVDQLEKRQMVCHNTLQILIGAIARGVDVAGVHADPQAFVLKGLDKVQELVIVRQELRALARRRFQKDRTGWCGGFHGLDQIHPHVLQGVFRRPRDGLPHVNHNTSETDALRIVQIFNKEGDPIVILGTRLHGQINDIRAVDIDPTGQRNHGSRAQGNVLILDGQLGGQSGTQEELDGNPIVFKSSERLHEFPLFDVGPDAVRGLQEEAWNGGFGGLGALQSDGQGLEGVSVFGSVGPGGHVRMPDRFLEREHEVDVGGRRLQGRIRVDLEQEVDPVLVVLPRELNFEDLRGRLGIGVALDLLIREHCVVGQGTLDDRVQPTLRGSQSLQERFCGLGLGQLALVRLGERRIPDLRGREQGLQIDRSDAEELLGHAAQQRVILLLGKDGQECGGIPCGVEDGHRVLRQQLL